MSTAVPSGRVSLIAFVALGVKAAAEPDKNAALVGGVNDELDMRGREGVEGIDEIDEDGPAWLRLGGRLGGVGVGLALGPCDGAGEGCIWGGLGRGDTGMYGADDGCC